MDQRLFDAAQTGNLQVLNELLTVDRLILQKVSLGPISETPLHVAALAGQIEFAKEIIRRRPEFAKELNKDGFSPIHLASANGYVEIVKELLTQVGSSLCVLKDIEGRTALHCAVLKGRIDVIEVLISAYSECIREVTPRNETVLHLAVKNNQFEALKGLLESGHVSDEVLNAKDRDGNTLLHLAISKKQYQTIEYLLQCQATVSRIEVNAKNAINLTAMDIFDLLLSSSSCELHDIEVREILRHAGAERSRDINMNNQQVVVVPAAPATPNTSHEVLPTVQQDHISIPIRQEPIISRATKLLKDFSTEIFGEIENSSSETRNILMVVAVLIATVTYQGGINPPGGVWQDHSHENNGTIITSVVVGKSIHHAGKAIMVYEHLCFILFMVFNTVGFFTSLIIISLLTSKFPLKAWLRLAVISMATAFGCGVCFIASFSGCIKIFLLLFFCGAVVGWYYWWIEKFALVTIRRLSNNTENRNFLQRIVRFIASHSFRPNNAVHQVDQL
ncbi:Ankyrin repeat [Macleaya cordata]|uniref:Ankyrin repeat n=1 Tax=Macleaya cordata TaxID=56857 RepID=A0A200RAU6_MACCD|nr:Ankyrin repeat [Macleaya cordata]